MRFLLASGKRGIMNTRIAALVEKVRALEGEIEVEVARRRDDLKFRIEQGRVRFEDEVLQRHRALKVALVGYIASARVPVILTAPFIYSLIIPFALLDAFVSVYQAVCFPVYGIPKVKRDAYFVFDREHLAYLNALEKLNCAYCSYGNGLIAYVREIASRTEQYWCPIKHARRRVGAHQRYNEFVDFGDAEAFRTLSEPIRKRLSEEGDKAS
jgi:hypothetical protein